MSGFSSQQLKKLIKKLDRTRVQHRELEGRQIDYIEGWFAVSEANAIFGYAGWDREMAHFERVFERSQSKGTSCAYLARVRIRVRAGERVVLREGTGFGHALAPSPADAHERALKAAETDATKRALATFGTRFGLTLYDKEQSGITVEPVHVRPPRGASTSKQAPAQSTDRLELRTETGGILAAGLSPEGFCSGLRQMIEAMRNPADLEGLRARNADAIRRLRDIAPELKASRGEHYADILEGLIAQRNAAFGVPLPANRKSPSPPMLEAVNAVGDSLPAGEGELRPPQAAAPNITTQSSERSLVGAAEMPCIVARQTIDKSVLTLGTTRRIRNKAHLARVGAQPCLVCEQSPTHAHHVTFAQPRGLSIKVSDEFTVPLCAPHHNELHRAGNEEVWWRKYGIDPLAAARALWQQSLLCAEG